MPLNYLLIFLYLEYLTTNSFVNVFALLHIFLKLYFVLLPKICERVCFPTACTANN